MAEERVKNLIPAPKKGYDFLDSSHYNIGFDERETKANMMSVTQGDYVNRKSVAAVPSREPDVAIFGHQDQRYFSDLRSETQKEYGSKKVEEPNPPPGDKGGFLATNFKMGDEGKKGLERTVIPPTTNHDYFPRRSLKDSNPQRFRPHALDSNLIEIGDRKALPQPDSDYKGNFKLPNRGRDVRQPPFHLLPTKTLGGDQRSHGDFQTASEEHFQKRAGGRDPPFPSKHHGTHVPMGDEQKQNDKLSIVGGSYRGHGNDALASPYDKKATVGEVYRSNFSCGDPVSYKIPYESVTDDSYQMRYKLPPVARVPPLHLLKSSLPEGPKNPERFLTTTEWFHPHQGRYGNKIVDGGDYMTVSNVNIGDAAQNSRFFAATTKSTYLPRDETRLDRPPPTMMTGSNVPMYAYKGDPVPLSTNTETYVRQKPRDLYDEDIYDDLKASHVRFPLVSTADYATEGTDQFSAKSGRKEKTNRHRHWKSSVPFGTFQKFITY